MGKARTDRRGYTREQALIQENRMLKKQVASLRKQLARLDIDRLSIAREVIEEHYREEKTDEKREILDNLKRIWACRKCEDGHLEIFIFNRGLNTFYYRICSNSPICLNRTKSKQYTPNVKGIIRKDKNEQD